MDDPSRELKVNFHNVLAARIHARHPTVQEFFAAEYQPHLVETLPEGLPTVSFRFRYWPEARPVPPGYTRHVHKVLARWAYRIDIAPEHVEIDAIGNHTAVPMTYHMLLHPSLRFVASQHGVLMLHAGAVALNGSSLIFTGRGGAGKTTTTSLMLSAGGSTWSLHADDYLFLTPGPESLAYLTRSHLYGDLLRWLPQLRARLSPGERLQVALFDRIRRWSGGNLRWPLRLDLNRLWPEHEFVMRARPAALLRLARAGVAAPALEPQEPGQLLEDLMAMNLWEARHFRTLLQKSGSLPDYAAWLESWQADERRLMAARLAEIPLYSLSLPGRPGNLQGMAEKVVEMLVGLASERGTPGG